MRGGGGTGLVLLHGWLGRGADWNGVRGHLGATIPTLAPDLPGHGLLDARGGATSMDQAADHVVSVMEASGIDRGVIAGYSMGGRLALHLALRYPRHASGLVLVSASAGLLTEREREERRRADVARAADLVRDPQGFVRRWYEMPLFDPLPDVQRAALAEDRLSHALPEGWASALRGLSVGRQPWHGDRLREIRSRTVVLAGAVDAKFSAIARHMAESGGFGCSIVPAAGHALLVERPDAVASSIGDVVAAVA